MAGDYQAFAYDTTPRFVRTIMSSALLVGGLAALIGAVTGSAATLFTLWVVFNWGIK
jgi:hypothetical protein